MSALVSLLAEIIQLSRAPPLRVVCCCCLSSTRRIGRRSGRETDASQAERYADRASLSLVPRSRSHARLGWNATMSHAFSMRFLLLLLAAAVVDGYRILALFPVPSKSHSNLGFGLVRPLLDAGHEVTFVGPFLEKSTNKKLTQINVAEVMVLTKDMTMVTKKDQGLSFVKEFSRNVTMMMMENKEVKEALLKNSYDAVITEWFFSDVQAGFASVLQCPWILLSSNQVHTYLEYLVGEINSPGVYPNGIQEFPIPMNFWQRLINTATAGLVLASIIYYDSPYTEADYKELFEPLAQARGVPLPNYYEALHNVSILLENSHHAIGTPKSLPLNVVEIGGYHIPEEVPKLPEDLQSILDRSTNGVVYFSMGSVLKSAHFSEDARKGLLQIFGSLPYTVLWKFEEELKGVPENVHVRPWMPQPGILAHPNTKVFITHGGLLSTLEAVNFGVPLIAIPVFGDQPMNVARAARSGYALKVDYGDRMVEDLSLALDKMLKDDSYYKRAKHLSGLFKKRPVSPQKLIVHYTELAIETGGAYHLRSKSALYPWYQRLLLDQLAFVAVLVVGIVFVVKRSVRMCRGRKRSVKIKKN